MSASAPARSNEEIACLAGAKAALYTWAATVATRDVEAILALYAADAILVPTLSNEVRDNEESRREYFRNFLARRGSAASSAPWWSAGSTSSTTWKASRRSVCPRASSSPSSRSKAAG